MDQSDHRRRSHERRLQPRHPSGRPAPPPARTGPSIDRRGIRAPASFTLREEAPQPGLVVLSLGGELDLVAEPEFRARVERAAAENARAVIVDLSRVTFVDSMMLHGLLAARGAMARRGGAFFLAGPSEPVLRLLDLTRAGRLFELCDSRAEALARLRGI